LEGLCISLIPDWTSHFLFNNFLNLLISLQLLTIMQQLEFSNILKELQVLVYFSLLTVIPISKPFVIVIGAPVVVQDNQWLILVCILEIPLYVGNQRSKEQYQKIKSSCEAEYRAMTTVTCEIQWLVYLLQDLKVPFEQPSLLYWDNDSTRYIVANPVLHERPKHIEIDCHIVREKLKKGLIHLLPISTIEQLA